MWKHFKRASRCEQQFKLYHNSIYNYTETRLRELANEPTFQTLFTYFVKSGGFDQFMTGDETLGKD